MHNISKLNRTNFTKIFSYLICFLCLGVQTSFAVESHPQILCASLFVQNNSKSLQKLQTKIQNISNYYANHSDPNDNKYIQKIDSLIQDVEQHWQRQNLEYSKDPQNPHILIIKPNIHSTNFLNRAAASILQKYQFQIEEGTHHPFQKGIEMVYDPKTLIEHHYVALFSTGDARIAIPHQVMILNSDNEYLSHEESHALYSYFELHDWESVFYNKVEKLRGKKVSFYQDGFYFDELIAFLEQLITSIQLKRSKTTLSNYIDYITELSQHSLHKELTKNIPKSLIELNQAVSSQKIFTQKSVKNWTITSSKYPYSRINKNSYYFLNNQTGTSLNLVTSPIIPIDVNEGKSNLNESNPKESLLAIIETDYFKLELHLGSRFFRDFKQKNFEKIISHIQYHIETMTFIAQTFKDSTLTLKEKLSENNYKELQEEALRLREKISQY